VRAGKAPGDAPSGAARAASQVDAAVTEPSAKTRLPFPIVGIGASAGGLEALERFFAYVPLSSGMAFVVVQHLDPTRKGLMPELLQRATAMKVREVHDRMRVRPDCVYVIPPGREMSILRGVLHLFAPTAARGLRLPIDTFLRSLALDQRQHSIGVILSGMGSDGTLGLRSIKEMAGLALVQDPASAKFDSMPRSAIEAGLADIVAPPDELAGRIASYLTRTPLLDQTGGTAEQRMRSAVEKAVILLRVHTGHDFSLYKRSTLYRRIERRMGIHQIVKVGDYVRHLQENVQELDLLFKELLIGVTSFFRDPAVWDQLRDRVLPELVAARPAGVLRAWVAGCSTGEEAYSLAIVLKEALDAVKPRARLALQVFATDLDRDAIDKARLGAYPENIAADVSQERLARFFSKGPSGYRVRNEIRECVVFAPHNLISDPPFTKLDVLSCRNLLIYLAPEMQRRLLPVFHYSLRPGGILVLGSAETVGGATNLFAPVNGRSRIFRRSESALRPDQIEFPSAVPRAFPGGSPVRETPRPALSLQAIAEQLILRSYAPPSVLTDDKGNILFVSGRTGAYLEPAAGKANWNVFAMSREGLESELSGAFHRALRGTGPVTAHGVRVGPEGAGHRMDVTVRRLAEPEALRGLVLIVFTEAATPPEPRGSARSRRSPVRNERLQELQAELRQARADLQSTREGMQTSQEELKSTNEELQSTNEELQSTNEELTTSKEEMQSMNEELQTVNHELQGKVDDFARVSDDMKNLLNSTDIATLFLDNELRVRRYTTQAANFIKLIPGDVGRPVTDLASDLLYPDLAVDTREVLRTLRSAEKPIACSDGRWFTVRILPYRTQDDRIDGVVITFADITVAKTLEAKLRERQASLERHIERQSGRIRKSTSPATARRANPEPGA
jgi:two-component system CheB/CheR fusion protein